MKEFFSVLAERRFNFVDGAVFGYAGIACTHGFWELISVIVIGAILCFAVERFAE